MKIRELLNQHIEFPFETLRERGVVAQLFAGLRRNRLFSDKVTAIRKPHRGKPDARAEDPVRVGRVQLEVTVRCRQDKACPVEKVFDLISFRDAPILYYGGQGGGDILQQVDASSIAAAVEVKASPSRGHSAGGAYAKDIYALLWLASVYKASAFFVLIDKSSPRFHGAGATQSTVAPSDWMTGTFALKDWGDMFRDDERSASQTSLDALGLVLSKSRPIAGTPCVEVWAVQPNGSGAMVPTVCFASLKANQTNRHLIQATARARAATATCSAVGA